MTLTIPSTRRRTLLGISVFWALAPLAAAQESLPPQEPVTEEEVHDAGSRYARTLYVEGRASLMRAYDGENVALDRNLPLIPGDRIEAPALTRIEIQLADTSLLRARGPLKLDIHSLTSLDSDEAEPTRLGLLAGELSVELAQVGGDSERAFQVDTPSGTTYLMTSGLYTIRVDAQGTTTVLTREGVAEVEGGGDTVLIRSGQATQVVKGDEPSRPVQRVARQSEFERWVDERRHALEPVEQEELSAEGDEIEDLPDPVQPYAGELSRYGRWETLPAYGTVWFPAGVAPGWSPYYYGYWVGSRFGSVWVSSEPWGWAPYHYGRWQWVAGYGWAWIPGSMFAGAWVEWWPGPSYVAWVPLGFYDRPAIDLRLVLTTGHRLPRYGWACVPYPVFYARDLPRRCIRDTRVLRAHMEAAVPVRRLPAFHPRHLRLQPGAGSDIYAAARRSSAQETIVRRTLADRPHPRQVTRSRIVQPGATLRSSRPVAAGPPIRTMTLQRRVGTGVSPPTANRPARVARPRPVPRAGEERVVTGRPVAAPPATPRAERTIRDVLGKLSRQTPPPAAGRDRAVRPAPSGRERAPASTSPRGGSSGPAAPRASRPPKSHPRGQNRN